LKIDLASARQDQNFF